MNYSASFRHLLNNSKAALLSAIEIYNKPRIEYRDETVVILLLNAWELLLKGALSKKRKSIFYPKEKGKPYKTLSLSDALERVGAILPPSIDLLPIKKNIELLSIYRDNAVHFYNAKDFGVLIHNLAQTSVLNYRDVLHSVFGVDLSKDITWQLLPLGVSSPVDPIAFLSKKRRKGAKGEQAVREFISVLARATQEVESAKGDTSKLMTPLRVKMESVKKIDKADFIAGIGTQKGAGVPVLVDRRVDPNISHPLRQKDILAQIKDLHGLRFTTTTFQALVWRYGIKEKPELYWKDQFGGGSRYSNEMPSWIRKRNVAELTTALKDFKEYTTKRRKRNTK